MDPEHRPFQRRTVLKTIGAGAVSSVALSGAVAAHRGGVSRELAEVRSTTAEYNNPVNAEADGYEGEDQAVCGMGYHYVNFDLVSDGGPEKLRPEGMVYGETDGGNLVLGAVEYIVPKAGSYEADPPSGLFDHADPEWDILDLGEMPLLWTLHAWVHTHNPDGVFHHTNPRKQFHPEDCDSH
ncbi:hypothetical protein GJ631_05205 [Natronomonas sp. CBA1123]|uniref:hypothetical protein n=1 Tax=Natronomonas sp. CBA1123 TaxID=2668070 RepID=UPI0012EA3F13|nr:hypothetical protein [Natronomonas sp. CBA1123]MUV85983.1 hypothetical protein [Natronomonas sp. CBA1123]